MNKEKKCFEEQREKDAAIGMWVNVMNRISNLDNREVPSWKKEFIRKWNNGHNDEAQIYWINSCPLCAAYSGNCNECPLKGCDSSSTGNLWGKVCCGKQNEALEAAHTILGHIFAMPVEPVQSAEFDVWFDKSIKEMAIINRSICAAGHEYVKLFEGSYEECRKWKEERKKFEPVMTAFYCDGSPIEYKNEYDGIWYGIDGPSWEVDREYREKDDESVKVTVWFNKMEKSMHIASSSFYTSANCIKLFEGTYEECLDWREKREQFIPVMTSFYCDGKKIEYKYDGMWYGTDNPSWRADREYRVKSEMWTVNISDEGIVSMIPACKWAKWNGKQLIEGTEDECKSYAIEHYCDKCVHNGEFKCSPTDKPECLCHGFKEKDKKRRWTNRELAKWLAESNGEWTDENRNVISACYTYTHADSPVGNGIVIRAWDETEWREPEDEE